MKKSEIKNFQNDLISWFEKEFRDLPWRQTSDPYKIWISEIMLQQTQVKKVIPYYERFIDALPSVDDLAVADLDQVLKLWEGLGYYARARNIHKAARIIVEQFAGSFPSEYKDVINLPGIGDYTAAAILSIAFGTDMPVIDGNVNRVLSRLFTVPSAPKSTKGKQIIQQKANLLFAHERPGIYNEAMMELGAVVCSPHSPKCGFCPVNRFCRAYASSTQEKFPVKAAKKKRPHKNIAIGIVWKNDLFLIDQRHTDGMLGGLWEFPGGHVEDGESLEDAVVREVKEELDVDVKILNHFATIEHQYTHFTITLYAYFCQYVSGTPKAIECLDWKWVKKEELDQFAFPGANRKVIDKLLASSPPSTQSGQPITSS